jgi:hypothetical protein
MPRAAVDAALDTFALVIRERHPGVIALPLREIGADGAMLSLPAGQVIRPFAPPERPHQVLDWNAADWNAGYGARHDRRVGRATEDAPAVANRPSS